MDKKTKIIVTGVTSVVVGIGAAIWDFIKKLPR